VRPPSAVDTPAFGATRGAGAPTLPFVVLDEGFASAVQETRDLDETGSAHRYVVLLGQEPGEQARSRSGSILSDKLRAQHVRGGCWRARKPIAKRWCPPGVPVAQPMAWRGRS
jgi:hypothetical protein